MKKDPCHNTFCQYTETFCKILRTMIEKMKGAELGDSISENFIVQMIPHHEAAIQMSENIRKHTNNPRICQIAESIIQEQTQSIADMEKARCICKKCKNSDCDLQSYEKAVRQIMQTMFDEMCCQKPTGNTNCDFLSTMIPHHEGAIKMSEEALKFCICEELKPILHAIIRSQKKGIQEMKQLLCCLQCAR